MICALSGGGKVNVFAGGVHKKEIMVDTSMKAKRN